MIFLPYLVELFSKQGKTSDNLLVRWDNSYNMAAVDEYAPEKITIYSHRQYVKKWGFKIYPVTIYKYSHFLFDIFQTCIFFEDFVFLKNNTKNTKVVHCFEMTTVTNVSPCNVANVTRTRAQYGGHTRKSRDHVPLFFSLLSKQ